MLTKRVQNTAPAETGDPSRGSIRKYTTGAAGIVIILLAYYALAWRSIAGLPKAYGCAELFSDFVLYYYPMGEAIFRTELPVRGFLYSPFAALLLAVFPPLGLTASLVFWGILHLLFIVLYLLLFRRLVPAGLPIQLLFVTLALFSFPLLLNLIAGQVTLFMTVGVLGALYLNKRGRCAAAAGLLILAVSFKFYPIIFIVPFAARRDARFLLLAAAACIVFLFVFPGLLLGAGDTIRFYGALADSFRDSDWVVANSDSQYFPHVVLRLAEATGQNVHAHLPLLRWIAFGIAAVNMVLLFLVYRARLGHADLWSFQLVFLTIPFVLKTSWPMEFIFLPFTQALLAWWLLWGKQAAPGADTKIRASRVTAWRGRIPHGRTAVTFCLLLASTVLPSMVFFNLLGDPYRYGFYGLLFWADLLLLVALYIELLPSALRRLREAQTASPGTP